MSVNVWLQAVIHNMHKVFHMPLLAILVLAAAGADRGPWSMHVVDASSKGADGVRLADANGDGFIDIATGWEEGGVVRVYLNPGPFRVKSNWPSVTVGRSPSPEDAVFADLDEDGATDVVGAFEGQERAVSCAFRCEGLSGGFEMAQNRRRGGRWADAVDVGAPARGRLPARDRPGGGRQGSGGSDWMVRGPG